MTKLGDLDAVFVSYDEPGADVFYDHVRDIWPRIPKRVHGVKGFHAAHAEAARIAETDRFITIDGDAWPWDDAPLRPLPSDVPSDCVISYGARNLTNGLIYGNGGLKVWPRRLLLNVPTHEAGGAESAATDFCYIYRYWQIPEAAADTIINQTPFQAFRAGYREGVKLTLDRGRKHPDWANAKAHIATPNFSRLRVWCSVGSDWEHGIWSILGARMGVFDLWVREIIHPDQVRDYDWFQTYWNDLGIHTEEAATNEARDIGVVLEDLLGPMPVLDATTSRWFKTACNNWPKQGLILPDLEVPNGW